MGLKVLIVKDSKRILDPSDFQVFLVLLFDYETLGLLT